MRVLHRETHMHMRMADTRNQGDESAKYNHHGPRCFCGTAGQGACAHLGTIEAAMRNGNAAWTFVSDNEGLQCFFVMSVPEHICCEQIGLGQQKPWKDSTGQRDVSNQNK